MLIGTTIVRASLPTRVISCPSNENRKSRSVVSYINVLFFFFSFKKNSENSILFTFRTFKIGFFSFALRIPSRIRSK